MLILGPNQNLAVIEFTVNKFVSVRQGTMMFSTDPPKDVTSNLASNTVPPRLSMPNNNTFEFVVGSRPPVQLAFAVLPGDDYAAVGLFVQKVSTDPDGGGVWDGLIVGNAINDNAIYVRNKGRRSDLPPSEYKIYMLVRKRTPDDAFPLGDIGVIDPVWINR